MKKKTLSVLILGLVVCAAISFPTMNANTKVRDTLGIVTDIGGRGDLSFNDMACKGADMAKAELGVKVIELVSITETDFVPNLRMLAKRGDCILIVGVGFLLEDAVKAVAKEYPKQNFAIVDAHVDMPNVMSLLFEENEGSALVGALAALIAAEYGYPHVGTALGIEIPDLWKFEIGYKWGVDWGLKWYEEKFGEKPPVIGDTPPRERVLWVYTGTFSDPIKGYQAAKAQFGQGAAVCFQVGGPIGIGVFKATREVCEAKGQNTGPPFAIGVDSDQDWIDPGFIIASMLKRVDNAVFSATKMALGGTFEGGVLELGLESDGVGISRLEDIDEFLRLFLLSYTGYNKHSTDIQPRALTFNDEFDSNKLDETKWHKRFRWGEIIINDELQGYTDNNFIVNNGILKIEARKEPVEYGGKLLDYTSGVLTSYHEQIYGIWEIRCKMPNNITGLWPAFWLVPADAGQTQTIILAEWFGAFPRYMTLAIATDSLLEPMYHYAEGDFSSDYHTYSAEWRENFISLSIDGVEQVRYDGPTVPTPMYMILNLAIAPHPPVGPPDNVTTCDDISFPAYFDIDYIRVYN